MSSAESDAQLVLKKRARRRLVGAIAFAVLAAVALPMVMDQAPPSTVPDVRISIPDSSQAAPFSPPLDTQLREPLPASKEAAAPPAPALPAAPPAAPPAPPPAAQKPTEVGVAAIADRPPAKAVPAPPPEKPAASEPARKAAEKPVSKENTKEASHANAAPSEAERAAAILSGKSFAVAPAPAPAPAPAAKAGNGEHIILIGAFSNSGNVKVIQKKLGELGIKVYTEPLDSPQGRKTRVRAGPFPTRDAAEKALAKMKRIGVSGDLSVRH